VGVRGFSGSRCVDRTAVLPEEPVTSVAEVLRAVEESLQEVMAAEIDELQIKWQGIGGLDVKITVKPTEEI
jgi:hypothetical protein